MIVRFLIVCEGSRTEPNYFRELIKNNKYSSVIDAEIKGEGVGTCSLVRKTVQLRAEIEQRRGLKFDSVWVVFDKDSFPDFNEAIELADKQGINSAWSNESFELWYYLHFEYLVTGIHRKDYIKKLNAVIRRHPGYEAYEYKKNDPNFYHLLQEIGSEEKAMASAQRMRILYRSRNYARWKPCTFVDLLVEELRNPTKVLE